METDLSIKIAGIDAPNPLFLASGIADETGYSMAMAVRMGAGGVVTKSLSLMPREGHRNPVVVELPYGLINAMGLPNPGVEDYGEEVKTFREETGGKNPVIGSVFGSTIEDYVDCAKAVQRIGVDALEINGSCPNAKGLGLEFGQDPEVIVELVRSVKAKVSIPVLFKLTPNCNDIVKLAEACAYAGADGIVAINTLRAMKIDVRTGRPVLTNVTGGLSGPAILPVGVRCVYDISSAVDIPVMAVGGVTGWEDALEYIFAGASAVQVGTAVWKKGLGVFSEISEGMIRFMEDEGYSSLKEMVGISKEANRWRS